MKRKIIAVMLIAVLIFSIQVPVFSDTAASSARDLTLQNEYAQQLKELGLFKGVSDTNFDLNRAPTRVEATIMLIRLLGEEKTAQNGQYSHPFTDVPKWADSYIGYAYEKGLTKGVSATKFGTGTANAQMYLTYVLRALGYSDAESKDFTYENPFQLAYESKLLISSPDRNNFLRADAVAISHASLCANVNNSECTLAESLIEKNVFSSEDYASKYVVQTSENATKVHSKELEYRFSSLDTIEVKPKGEDYDPHEIFRVGVHIGVNVDYEFAVDETQDESEVYYFKDGYLCINTGMIFDNYYYLILKMSLEDMDISVDTYYNDGTMVTASCVVKSEDLNPIEVDCGSLEIKADDEAEELVFYPTGFDYTKIGYYIYTFKSEWHGYNVDGSNVAGGSSEVVKTYIRDKSYAIKNPHEEYLAMKTNTYTYELNIGTVLDGKIYLYKFRGKH